MPYKDPSSDAAKASRRRIRERYEAKKGPDWNRNRQMIAKYGIGVDDYNAMLTYQNGLCAICGESPDEAHRWKDVAPLVVDHDHETGQVRGLLCPRCNRAIGQFNECLETIEAAVSYLQRAKEAQLEAFS